MHKETEKLKERKSNTEDIPIKPTTLETPVNVDSEDPAPPKYNFEDMIEQALKGGALIGTEPNSKNTKRPLTAKPKQADKALN
jgi:hypothetical protein